MFGRWIGVALLSTLPLASNACKVSHDEFAQREDVSVSYSTGKLGGLFSFLLVKVTEKGITRYSVQALYSFETWKFLGERAIDDSQVELPVQAQRDTHRGSVMEIVLVGFPDAQYLKDRSEGFKVKVYGKRGDEILEIPGELVKEFLACTA